MINIPIHHWNTKLDFSNSQFLFKVNFDILNNIKRYNDQKQKLENNGHEKRFRVKIGYISEGMPTPFAQYTLIKTDDAIPYVQDHIFWIGIEIMKI